MSTKEPIGGFHWEHVSHSLQILDKSFMTIRTSHEFQILALRRERFFERRVQWTGSGVEKEPQILTGKDELGHSRHQLHGPVIRDGNMRVMLIDLGRWLEVGERDTVGIEHTFIDVERTLDPYLGGFAREGTKTVNLQVLLPSAFDGQVRSEEYPPNSTVPSNRIVLGGKTCTVDEQIYRVYTLNVSDAKPGYNYKICWPKQG